jgi:hypothetical protein
MKKIVLVTLLAIGVGLTLASSSMAAAAGGSVIGQAAAAASPVTEVWCRWHGVCGSRGCWRRRVCW